jgi:hypothetical protein
MRLGREKLNEGTVSQAAPQEKTVAGRIPGRGAIDIRQSGPQTTAPPLDQSGFSEQMSPEDPVGAGLSNQVAPSSFFSSMM